MGKAAIAVTGILLVYAAVASRAQVPAKTQPQNSDPVSPKLAEFFESKIRPVLADRCFKCHGPDKQKGGLRLDSRGAIVRGGTSGPAIVLGKPGESLLIEALQQQGELKMPPDDKLPGEVVAQFKQWIELGAPWPGSTTQVAGDVAWRKH